MVWISTINRTGHDTIFERIERGEVSKKAATYILHSPAQRRFCKCLCLRKDILPVGSKIGSAREDAGHPDNCNITRTVGHWASPRNLFTSPVNRLNFLLQEKSTPFKKARRQLDAQKK